MIRSDWTSLDDLRRVAEKKWDAGVCCAEAVEPGGVFPYRIPLKHPSPADIDARFDEVRAWVRGYASDGGAFFHVEWKEVNHRLRGKNAIPVAAVFDSLAALSRFVKKEKDLSAYVRLFSRLVDALPGLKGWAIANPFELLAVEDDIEKIIRVTRWILDHPRPAIYLRQLSLDGVDTKYIESRKKIAGEWLDTLLDSAFIDTSYSGVKGFERRYGFLQKPELVRFRILDPEKSIAGLTDLSVRADDFRGLDVGVETVFIVENEITFVSFPEVENAALIFGHGYGFEALRGSKMLSASRLVYWGDIDTHGFAILSQFRGLFPSAESMLMDRVTLELCRGSWVHEPLPVRAMLSNLNDSENSLYDDLKNDAWGPAVRLEQEFVPFELLMKALVCKGFILTGCSTK